MPNSLSSTGLTIATQSELVTNLTSAFQTIYGSSISLASNTPDGQLMMIIVQSMIDNLDLAMSVYNSFDPDQAFGSTLDQRVSINGIQRLGGTFTITNVTITTTQAVNLYGLDQTAQPVFTVQDNAGNQWQLQTTQLGFSAPSGTALAFQAANPGAVLTVIGTITTAVTQVLGVSAINNPTTYSTLGENEETDAALRIRRQKSVSLSSTGYLSGLLAALENISGVTSAFVYENTTGATNVNGVPGHSIWVIVGGTAAASAIANAIYTKRASGCGMFGGTTYNVTQADGTTFQVAWDTVVSQTLYTQFTAASVNGNTVPNYTALLSTATGLPVTFNPSVNQEVNVSNLTTLVQAIDPNTLVLNSGFSTSSGGPFTNTLSPTSPKYQFTVAVANIIILPILLQAAGGSITVSGGAGSSTYVSIGSATHSGATVAMSTQGGFGTMTYSIQTNNSGGSINSSSGVYTPGSTGGVVDTILVTDGLSNTATCAITVA